MVAPVEEGKKCYNLSGAEQYCQPFGCPEDEDFWDPTKNGRAIGDGLGSSPTYGTNDDLNWKRSTGRQYPGRPLEEMNNAVFTVAADRSPSTFALSRHLDFRKPREKKFRCADGNGWPNQYALVAWFNLEKKCFELPFGLDTQLIPPKIDWQSAYWCVERPKAGIVFDIVEKYSGTVLKAGIDGGVAGSGKIKIPDSLCWSHDKNRVLQICITAMPPLVEDDCKIQPDIHGRRDCGALDDWAIMTSACVHCPDTGK